LISNLIKLKNKEKPLHLCIFVGQKKILKIPLAQSIIQICEAKGIHTIIISPGSTPLTIGFASNPTFTSYSIADERSAALRNKLKTCCVGLYLWFSTFELLSCILQSNPSRYYLRGQTSK
jgi:hypothetical protein